MLRLLTSTAFAASASLMALSGIARAQINPAISGGAFADSFCGGDFCLTGIYTPSTSSINYTMIIAGDNPQGWRAVGQGSEMAGANMLIAWTANGKPVLSHRSSSGYSMPSESRAIGTFTANNDVSRTTTSNGGMTVVSWTFPQTSSPGSTFNHIWASAPSTPSGATSTSSISKHNDHGMATMDFTLRYDGEAPKVPSGVTALTSFGGSTASTGSSNNSAMDSSSGRDLSKYHNRVWIAHMVFMIVAWLVLVPSGIFIGRFGRSMFRWFPVHRNVQLAALVSLFIGFFLAVGSVSSAGKSHFDGTHQQVGLAIFILAVVQAILGQFGHVVKREKGWRVQNYVHILLGLLLFCLAVWNIHLGFEAWSWWRVPNSASYVIYAWAGFLGVVYLAGLALLPRQLREESGYDSEKRGLTKQPSP